MSAPDPPESDPAAKTEPGDVPQLTRVHWILIGLVIVGAFVIAAIGFAGSYSAVRDLAQRRGFGSFAPYFPIGIDAGIFVMLALDLTLTWIRMPFPLLRQTAWLLTAATIAFNGAAAWPDPLGVGMHATIPLLFIIAVEAARHAVGRMADIVADKDMDGIRFSRWLLAFPSTFRLWRRMKLWELRSYEYTIRLEQDRLVYESRLRAKYGRRWKRQAPVDAMTPLRLARYGVPLARTGPAGLAAAEITGPLPYFTSVDEGRTSLARTTEGADKAPADDDFADNRHHPADKAEADSAADNQPAAEEKEADKQEDNADTQRRGTPVSALSGRTSAPGPAASGLVRADNSGQSQSDATPQVSNPKAEAGVRPDAGFRPLAAGVATPVSAPDNQQGADNRAVDNEARSDKSAADKHGPDNQADSAPRGALSAGVRAQLAAGITDPRQIAQHLSAALQREVNPSDVARIARRDAKKHDERPANVGQYL